MIMDHQKMQLLLSLNRCL